MLPTNIVKISVDPNSGPVFLFGRFAVFALRLFVDRPRRVGKREEFDNKIVIQCPIGLVRLSVGPIMLRNAPQAPNPCIKFETAPIIGTDWRLYDERGKPLSQPMLFADWVLLGEFKPTDYRCRPEQRSG